MSLTTIRRLELLGIAQTNRQLAQTYRDMGLYSAAAQQTIAASKAEADARALTAIHAATATDTINPRQRRAVMARVARIFA